MVPVSVEEASRVVSERTVPTAVMTVVPTVDVAIIDPSDVTVVLYTVTAVNVTVVSTGTLSTVCVRTTVSNVVNGSVNVSVSVLEGPVVELGRAVSFAGTRVAEETLGKLVGKGCTGGLPPVSSVVMTDPVVSGRLPVAFVVVGV